jgi:arsenate reductase (glutaredoxin)
MIAHPILINRPMAVAKNGLELCRPSEVVLSFTPNPNNGAIENEFGRRNGDEAVVEAERESFSTAC